MLRLHDYLASGNGYKVRLLLAHLAIPFELIEYDILKGETRTPEFLARNANGRIPVLELEDGRFLAESNAVLFFLADGTAFLPTDSFERAETLQWMFFEQYSHEPYIATSRFILHYLPEDHPRRATLGEKRDGGYAALKVMELRLEERQNGSSGTASQSPTSRFSPTPMWPTKAASTSTNTPMCGLGSTALPACRATSPLTGGLSG